ncbi:MAG: hypothetical protein JWQ98_3483 [Chlorobi bacterium]|nr:hypothetical protein [Chlorobiota bacterium]
MIAIVKARRTIAAAVRQGVAADSHITPLPLIATAVEIPAIIISAGVAVAHRALAIIKSIVHCSISHTFTLAMFSRAGKKFN